jgi:hypothetical protein
MISAVEADSGWSSSTRFWRRFPRFAVFPARELAVAGFSDAVSPIGVLRGAFLG